MPAAPACAPRGCLCRRPPAPPPSCPRRARTMIAAAFLVLLRPYSIQCALFLLLLLLGTIATIVFFCCWHRKLQKGRHPMKSVFSGRSRSRGKTRRVAAARWGSEARLARFCATALSPIVAHSPSRGRPPRDLTSLARLALTRFLQSPGLGEAQRC